MPGPERPPLHCPMCGDLVGDPDFPRMLCSACCIRVHDGKGCYVEFRTNSVNAIVRWDMDGNVVETTVCFFGAVNVPCIAERINVIQPLY
jgi:hypothetical protein